MKLENLANVSSFNTDVQVKFDYTAQEPHELSIYEGEMLKLIDGSKNWWKVANGIGSVGYVPKNYVSTEPVINGIPPTRPPKAAYIHESKEPSGLLQEKCHVVYPYEPKRSDELRLQKGDLMVVLDKSSDGWWKGQLSNDSSKAGWFPSNYVQPVDETEFRQREKSSDENVFNDFYLDESVKNPSSASSTLPVSDLHYETERRGQVAIEVVECLYQFEAQNSEELSFKKGEILEIIDKPINDPEWYLARNSTSQTGLIPNNYIRAIDERHHPLAFRKWYYGSMTREESDKRLNTCGMDGDFLVRDSESNPGDFSISLKNRIKNKHFWVHQDSSTGQYNIGNRSFPTMDELIEFYTKNPIFSDPEQELYLVRPLSKEIFVNK